jgi:hypothetical protein
VTDAFTDSFSPSFDPGGKNLYFISRRTLNPEFGTFELNMQFSVTDRIYVTTLVKDEASPVAPQSDEEKGDEADDDKKKDKEKDKDAEKTTARLGQTTRQEERTRRKTTRTRRKKSPSRSRSTSKHRASSNRPADSGGTLRGIDRARREGPLSRRRPFDREQ